MVGDIRAWTPKVHEWEHRIVQPFCTHKILRMSPPPSPSSESTINDVIFTVALTVYSTIRKTVKNKTTTKEEKAVKTKELAFAVNGSGTNYLNFLQAAPRKHSQDLFKITEAKAYPFKYIIGVKQFVAMSHTCAVAIIKFL